jgi:hypothetical protein
MAFDKIFKGSPVDEITPASPESPNLGVDVVNDTLYVNSGNGWVEVGGGGSGNLTGTLTPGNMPIASAAHTVVDGPISYDSNSDVVKILAAENSGTNLFIAANSGVMIDTIPSNEIPGLGGGNITLLSGSGIIISNFDQGPPSEGSFLSITNNDTGGTSITDSGGGGISVTSSGSNGIFSVSADSGVSFNNTTSGGTIFTDSSGVGFEALVQTGSAVVILTNRATGGILLQDIGGGGINLSSSGSGVIGISGGSGGVSIDGSGGGLTLTGIQIPGILYSAAGTALPDPTLAPGGRAVVSDATANVYGTAYASGGAITAPVYSDGTNWNMG